MLPSFIRRSRLIFLYKRMAAKPDYLFWKLKGSPRPRVPHLVKQTTLREYARRFQLPVLIETGTQVGQMIDAMEKRLGANAPPRSEGTDDAKDAELREAMETLGGGGL